jgi:serine/threonine protein kinase
MTEVWTEWEGQVINGVFPLHRFLSASDHSAVFLTEYKAQNLHTAALKLVSAIPALAQAQVAQWTKAATLAHPHLIRLFEAGRCQIGSREFIFVVMEYAEQTLSQILRQRALTPGEVREMLLPTLSALAFLHRRNLVQGQLKPSNMLSVNDQLKLASDTVRPADDSTAKLARPSIYDPPEAADHGRSAAGDIWSLGITMVEALTQRLPSWLDGGSDMGSFSDALPPTFVAIVRQCLDRNPANRPTADDVLALINPAPQLALAPVSARTTAMEKSPKQRWLLPTIAVLCTAVITAAWVGSHMLGSRASLQRAASPIAAPPTAASQNAETPRSAPRGSVDSSAAPSRLPPLPSVLHEEIPDVPRHIRDTIRGHIKVSVRVIVDSTGNVAGETLEKPGPSKYFARLATEAAGKWKFAPAGNHGSRKWLLQFEFSRDGAAGHAIMPRS